MKRILLPLLLLASPSSYSNNYMWFENDWVMDRDSTITENPVLKQLSSGALNKFFKGYNRWKVSGGLIAIFPSPESEGIEVVYSIQASSDQNGKFVLFLTHEILGQSSFLIARNKTGFCATMVGLTMKDLDGKLINEYWEQNPDGKLTECYVPLKA